MISLRLISLILIAVFLLTYSFCFAEISVDKDIPYRIYIGDNKEIDWVNVEEIRAIDDIEKVLFKDLSPIEEIYKYENKILNPTYIIIKEKSIWKLYWDNDPLKCILQLEYPLIERYSPEYMKAMERKEKLIYQISK